MSHPMDSLTYILVDRKPVQHANDDEWWRWYNVEENRRVAKDYVGDVCISTVFISLDLRAPPNRGKLFETKVFRDGNGGEERYAATWEEAERVHAEVVALVKQGKA